MDVLTPARRGYATILSPRELTLPLNPDIGGFKRFELEIGFGNGEYTTRRATDNPETLFIGMEVSPGCILRCARRARDLNNLRLIRTDARYMMKELFADGALDQVYMNFPCPWPKNRHAHRRVTAQEFTDDLAAVLKVGGAFELVTDEGWYADEVHRLLDAHEALDATTFEINPQRSVTTKYERKWLEQGKAIYRLTFLKNKDFSVARRCWSERDMHVKTGHPLDESLLADLSGLSGNKGEARWVFKKYYADPGSGKSFLVEVLSTDDEFEQRYYLKVVGRGEDTLIKMDATAQAFLTPAVRGAVEDLADRLSPNLAATEARRP